MFFHASSSTLIKKVSFFNVFHNLTLYSCFFILFTKVLDWNWKAKMRPFEEFLSTVNNMSHFIGAEIVISNILHCIIYIQVYANNICRIVMNSKFKSFRKILTSFKCPLTYYVKEPHAKSRVMMTLPRNVKPYRQLHFGVLLKSNPKKDDNVWNSPKKSHFPETLFKSKHFIFT